MLEVSNMTLKEKKNLFIMLIRMKINLVIVNKINQVIKKHTRLFMVIVM